MNGRLVGSPSWVVGSDAVIDGRARFAKRYSIVVKTIDSWTAEIEPDWARFKAGPKADALFEAVRQYAQEVFGKLSSELVEDSCQGQPLQSASPKPAIVTDRASLASSRK